MRKTAADVASHAHPGTRVKMGRAWRRAPPVYRLVLVKTGVLTLCPIFKTVARADMRASLDRNASPGFV